MVSPARLCLICKGGRNLCGNTPCPLLPRIIIAPEIRKRIKTELFGPGYNIFVGRSGYPNVGIGPMVAMDNVPHLDSPGEWFGMEYQNIVKLRSYLIRSKQRENIFSRSRLVTESQEIALSSKPPDIELKFKKKPVYHVSFSDIVQPMGPTAPLEKLKVVDNPKIPKIVDKIVSDDLTATQSSFMLYRSGLDVHKVTSILSSGALGREKNRKLVPTRWSITAVDDIIAKELMRRIRDYPPINEYMVFESTYLDNHFVILMMPGNWEFENFEAWAPGSFWSANLKRPEILEEYEPFHGRTTYAEEEGGGYYASRISCCEYLNSINRQARVVVFREVYEGYVIPLGVWVVRETSRNAYKNRPMKFSTIEEALNYCDSRLRLPLKEYLKKSIILRQSRLSEWMRKPSR